MPLRGASNNGQVHLFLGDPYSYGRDKTVVERGCAFSPGVWTAGLSVAVKNGGWFSPETRTLPLAFEGGTPPVVESRYEAGDGVTVRCRLCTLGGRHERTCDLFEAVVIGAPEQCRLMVRDIGAAGARIERMEWDAERRRLTLNGAMEMIVETPIDRAELLPADAAHDSPCAYLWFTGALRLRVNHGYQASRPAFNGAIADGFAEARRRWHSAVPATLQTPDGRIDRMWQQTAFHMLSAMERGLPRIGVENYPVLWIRDCVLVLRCLDLIGRSELARIGCEALADTVFCGGFGCESDNPGEGVWALVRHARLTGDDRWLREVYPTIERRVRWIERMLEADEPILRPGDSRTPYAMTREDSDVLCYAHEGGHIHGRMDWHSPDFYINCWAYAGLALAAEAAERLDKPDQARRWRARADALDAEIGDALLPDYGNERDPCVAPYPTGALSAREDALRERFAAWYRRSRLTPQGERVPEPLWTYFEAAQIHNAMLLGLKSEAWASLDGLLSDPRWLDMALMQEGEPGGAECLPFGRFAGARGWLGKSATGGNMPHNWATAETFLLLRDAFVTERPGGLLLLAGAPDEWRKEGSLIRVRDWRTDFGTISFDAAFEGQGWRVTILRGEGIPYSVADE